MDAPAVIVAAERLAGVLLARTAHFPKSARFTFGARIDDATLDLVEALALARYARRAHQDGLLEQADRALIRLRLLVRLAHDQRHLSDGALEEAARGLDEVGKMVGGWRAHLA